MKKLKIVILGLIVFLTSTSSVFAKFCSTTSTTSPTSKSPICWNWADFINEYLSEVTNLISSIKLQEKGKPWKSLWSEALNSYIWSYEISKDFESKGTSNFFKNLVILVQDSHIIKDRSKLTNYKKYISDLYLRISKEWRMIDDTKERETIIQKMRTWKYFLIKDNDRIQDYQDLFEYIWWNQLLIEAIYYEVIDVGSADIEKIKEEIVLKEWFDIDLEKTKKFAQTIHKSYYKKWKKIECSKTRDNFIRHMHNMICNIWDDAKESVERFHCNYQRLKSLLKLSWWSQWWNCGSVELKEWVPINDRISVTGGWKVVEMFEEMWKMVEESTEFLKDSMDSIFQPWKDCRTQECWPAPYDTNDVEYSKYKNKMWIATQQIIQDINEVNGILSSVESSDFTHNTTINFPKISEKVWQIRENIEKKEDSVFENTAQACENQSPYGKRCRP